MRSSRALSGTITGLLALLILAPFFFKPPRTLTSRQPGAGGQTNPWPVPSTTDSILDPEGRLPAGGASLQAQALARKDPDPVPVRAVIGVFTGYRLPWETRPKYNYTGDVIVYKG